jgi:hypothetical protein
MSLTSGMLAGWTPTALKIHVRKKDVFGLDEVRPNPKNLKWIVNCDVCDKNAYSVLIWQPLNPLAIVRDKFDDALYEALHHLDIHRSQFVVRRFHTNDDYLHVHCGNYTTED